MTAKMRTAADLNADPNVRKDERGQYRCRTGDETIIQPMMKYLGMKIKVKHDYANKYFIEDPEQWIIEPWMVEKGEFNE